MFRWRLATIPSVVLAEQAFFSFLFLFFNTVIAKAVETGAGAALIHINFTAGPSEAPATVTAEAQREMVLIQLLHAHRAVLAWIVGLAGEELTIWTWSEAERHTHRQWSATPQDTIFVAKIMEIPTSGY